MKKISAVLFSSSTAILLIVILTVSMGAGTFIEDKHDTATARYFIYNAFWFEFLFFLLAVNFIGHIKQFNMIQRGKIGGLVFHLSFIIMILGAGITRYFGFEGTMHIREGQSSNVIYSSAPYLHVSYKENNSNFNKSLLTDHSFHVNVPSEENTIEIYSKDFINNVIEEIQENVNDGVDIIELIIAKGQKQDTIKINSGEVKNIGTIEIAFNNTSRNAININEKEGQLIISSPYLTLQTNISGALTDTIEPGDFGDFNINHAYHTSGAIFLFSKLYKRASTRLISGSSDQSAINALTLDILVNGKKHRATVFGGVNHIPDYHDFVFDNVILSLAYGDKPIEIPFSIYLKDFQLERYAGSESPSSYASEVVLIDERNNLKQDYRIFMNYVLDYDKYRFFQSSYDKDEKGTMLSVSYDFFGTWISYFGYSLLIIGCIITLFSKSSRFNSLSRYIKEIRSLRRAQDSNAIPIEPSAENAPSSKSLKARFRSLFISSFIFGLPILSFGQIQKPVDASHADKFGHLITQAPDGRFEPVNSLVYDVLHKISRKDKFYFEGKGEMDAMQVFLDMIIDPEFWNKQKIIYIKEQSVRDIIGIKETHASLLDFFDSNNQYKLQFFAETAFRKKQSEQNKFDKEIIKVDERLNILIYVIRGTMLKIFPEQISANNKWISWDESTASVPLTGVINIINNDLGLETLNYYNIMLVYLNEVIHGIQLGDYSKANKVLNAISLIQAQHSELLPSHEKVSAEIFYNKAQIFNTLRNWYAVLGVLLLIFAFIDNVKTIKNRSNSLLLNLSVLLLGVAFLYQTFGMLLRWYLLGYAPWSNGYEALLLVAWGGMFAGFCFVRYSKITLSATAILAFFTLMTASHSSYDPQLTSLQPVLKSYWLILHVATLTISYGFFGLGFILGIINLFICLFKTKINNSRMDFLITELTFVNEMNLTIGVVLATIGTFLGGVWANESWGRYWGWDAKETWALIITLVYTLVLHLRFIPKLNRYFVFNVASVLGFGSVLMTFFGVNYYMSKGLHSYASGSTPIFPLWAWITILSVLALILVAGIKERRIR